MILFENYKNEMKINESMILNIKRFIFYEKEK